MKEHRSQQACRSNTPQPPRQEAHRSDSGSILQVSHSLEPSRRLEKKLAGGEASPRAQPPDTSAKGESAPAGREKGSVRAPLLALLGGAFRFPCMIRWFRCASPPANFCRPSGTVSNGASTITLRPPFPARQFPTLLPSIAAAGKSGRRAHFCSGIAPRTSKSPPRPPRAAAPPLCSGGRWKRAAPSLPGRAGSATPNTIRPRRALFPAGRTFCRRGERFTLPAKRSIIPKERSSAGNEHAFGSNNVPPARPAVRLEQTNVLLPWQTVQLRQTNVRPTRIDPPRLCKSSVTCRFVLGTRQMLLRGKGAIPSRREARLQLKGAAPSPAGFPPLPMRMRSRMMGGMNRHNEMLGRFTHYEYTNAPERTKTSTMVARRRWSRHLRVTHGSASRACFDVDQSRSGRMRV